MEVSKETLEAIFKSVDLEHNGWLRSDGIVSVMNEIGQSITVEEAQQIIASAGSEKNRITFQEFYFYHSFSSKYSAGNANKVLKAKAKFMKSLTKLHKKLSDTVGSVLNQQQETGKNTYGFQINVGKFDQSKYELGFEVRAGQENTQYLQKTLNHFSQIDESKGCFLYSVRAKNPQLVREKLEDFITNGLDLAESMIPEDQAPMFQLIKNDTKIEYATTDDQVFMRIHSEHELADHALKEIAKLTSAFNTEAFSVFAKVKVETKAGVEDLINNPSEPVPDVLSKGLRVNVDLDVNSEFVEAGRTFFFNQLDKLIQANKGKTYPAKRMKEVAVLVLLQHLRLVLNFSSFQEFCKDLQLNDIGNAVTFGKLGAVVKGTSVKDLLANIPFVADLVDVYQTQCEGHFSFAVLQRDWSVTVYQRSENMGKLWEAILQ